MSEHREEHHWRLCLIGDAYHYEDFPHQLYCPLCGEEMRPGSFDTMSEQSWHCPEHGPFLTMGDGEGVEALEDQMADAIGFFTELREQGGNDGG